ncbi:unnamed protein product [Meloidogyne enterolobii]|uniref:Uncharacterized protein n=1 Tax=Meloidogyne enterolobii TaxID=390850 RepID=A0ACB1ASW9_MELEN
MGAAGMHASSVTRTMELYCLLERQPADNVNRIRRGSTLLSLKYKKLKFTGNAR